MRRPTPGSRAIPISVFAVAVVSVVTVRRDPFTLFALPIIIGLLIGVRRTSMREGQVDDTWRNLEAAGQEINQLSESDIVDVAVARTAALLRADRVELVLRDHEDPVTAYAYTGFSDLPLQGPHHCEPPAPVPAGALRLHQGDGDDTFLEVGLNGLHTSLGVLRVGFSGNVIADRDRQVLTTFANDLSMRIVNARLYADALREAQKRDWAAHHDTLTGLLNRDGLLSLSKDTDGHAAERETFAVVVLDLDHFKAFNATLGHDAGDRLLQRISCALVQREDIACRLGGDRFAVLVHQLPDRLPIDSIVEDILRVITAPTGLDGMLVAPECSVGYAVAPADGRSIAELLARAEVAAGQAKQSPGPSCRWRAEHDTTGSWLELAADMEQSLKAGGQLRVHFQPTVDLPTGVIRSVEALVRWEHSQRGLLSPAELIPLAEQSGLARPFTLAVLDAAVKEAASWVRKGLGRGEITIAVNISARNLLDRGFPDDVRTICARYGLPVRQLVVEVSQSVLISELEIVAEVLTRLRHAGIGISVDDFGSGHSSLKLLRSHVNEVKIDKSFVSAMVTDPAAAAIVEASIELGHGLGLRVVAVGVETQEQLEALAAAHCDAVQGFLLARPMTASDLREAVTPANRVALPLQPMWRRTSA